MFVRVCVCASVCGKNWKSLCNVVLNTFYLRLYDNGRLIYVIEIKIVYTQRKVIVSV